VCHRAPLAALIAVLGAATALPAAGQERASERASARVRAIERAAARVLETLGRARRFQRTETAECMDGPLAELDASLRLATERLARMRRAEERGDDEAARRERATIEIALERAHTSERSALECVGPETAHRADWTEVTVERDDALAERAPRRRRR
jgi:hypothetical protein